MRIKTKISIALFVLLFFSMQTAPAFDDAVAFYYSDKLNVGDEFTWAINIIIEKEEYPGYFDFLEYEYGISNDSIVTLTILQDPANVNFYWEVFNSSEFNNFFSLTIGEINLQYEKYDEIYPWFLIPTRIDYANGTTQNPAEKLWAFFVIDDFYFSRDDTTMNIETSGDVITYDCYLNYSESENIAFYGQIDKSKGLMLYFKADINYTDTVMSLIYEIQNYTARLISLPLPIYFLILLTIPIISFKRCKK